MNGRISTDGSRIASTANRSADRFRKQFGTLKRQHQHCEQVSKNLFCLAHILSDQEESSRSRWYDRSIAATRGSDSPLNSDACNCSD